jgi:hypothetical protein
VIAAQVQFETEQAEPSSERRTAFRRELCLERSESQLSCSAGVIRNLTSTGLLLETAERLTEGEWIYIEIPEASQTRALVKWSTGSLSGCEFERPISTAAVSAALLQAAPALPNDIEGDVSATSHHRSYEEQLRAERQLSLRARTGLVLGLGLLSWAATLMAAVSFWRYFH